MTPWTRICLQGLSNLTSLEWEDWPDADLGFSTSQASERQASVVSRTLSHSVVPHLHTLKLLHPEQDDALTVLRARPALRTVQLLQRGLYGYAGNSTSGALGTGFERYEDMTRTRSRLRHTAFGAFAKISPVSVLRREVALDSAALEAIHLDRGAAQA